MSDRLYFSGLALFAVGMIALAVVWPQGLGARSPGPFGHEMAKPAAAKAAPSTPSLLPIIPTGPAAPAHPAPEG